MRGFGVARSVSSSVQCWGNPIGCDVVVGRIADELGSRPDEAHLSIEPDRTVEIVRRLDAAHDRDEKRSVDLVSSRQPVDTVV